MFEVIKLIGVGIILGVANVIPGVSGGTMAVVFNVYERLLSVITLNVKKILSQWTFILPLGGGLVLGVILFSKLITFLFNAYPVQTNTFFLGLIAGSVPLILRKIQSANVEKKKVSIIIPFLLAFALMIVMLVITPEKSAFVYTTLSLSLFFRLVLASAAAAVAMIIPGISGSFLMIVLGMYTTIIGAVSDLNILLLIPVALGVLIGLFFGAQLVKLLMAKVPSQTYGAILGLVAGSLLVIFPLNGFVESFSNGQLFLTLLFSIVSATLGFFIALFSAKNET